MTWGGGRGAPFSTSGTVVPRGGGAKPAGALPKPRIFCPKIRFFLARNSLGAHSERTNKGKRLLQFRCGLISPCQRAGALKLHDMSEKHPKNGAQKPQNSRTLATNSPNQDRAVSWAMWLKSLSQGHLVHPQPPIFRGFQSPKSPHETPTPTYLWSLGGARGQPGPHGGGQRWVQQFSSFPGRRK